MVLPTAAGEHGQQADAGEEGALLVDDLEAQRQAVDDDEVGEAAQ